MNDKIRPTHLERVAFVYVRQSTLHQVRNHQESRRRQYELQTRARELGFRQVEVIDEDLGVSGTGSKERPGFGRLLAAVCEGRVGAMPKPQLPITTLVTPCHGEQVSMRSQNTCAS